MVWFGEAIPTAALEAAFAAAKRCDVFLSIGTSSQVYPAASLAELAQAAGACVVEVNPQPTPHSHFASYLLNGPAGVMLPALTAELTRALGSREARCAGADKNR